MKRAVALAGMTRCSMNISGYLRQATKLLRRPESCSCAGARPIQYKLMDRFRELGMGDPTQEERINRPNAVYPRRYKLSTKPSVLPVV